MATFDGRLRANTSAANTFDGDLFDSAAAGDDAQVSGSIVAEAGAAAPLRVGLYGVAGIGFSASAAGTVAPFVAAAHGALTPASGAGGDLTSSSSGAGSAGLDAAIAAALAAAGEGLGAVMVEDYAAGAIGEVGSSVSASAPAHGSSLATVAPILAYAGRSELEAAYLPLNGSTQYGYAANALSGITAADTWTTAIKVYDITTIAGYGAWLYAYDNTTTGLNQIFNRVWTLVQQGAGGVYVGKATAAGVAVINSLSPASSAVGVPKVIAITQSPGNVKLRLITAAGVEATVNYPYTSGSPNDRDPLHLALGGQLNESHAIAVPSQMGNAKNTAVVVAMGDTSSAELQAWLLSYDAREHITDLRNYWPLAATVGSTVPDVVGGADMTLVAITDSSLVQTATPDGGLSVPVTATAGGDLTAGAMAFGSQVTDVGAASSLEAGSAYAAALGLDGPTEASLSARAAGNGGPSPSAAVSAALGSLSAVSGSLGLAGQIAGELQALVTSAVSTPLSGGALFGLTALGLASQSIRLGADGQGRALTSSVVSAQVNVSASDLSALASRGAGTASPPLLLDVTGVVVQIGSGAPGFVFAAAAGGDTWVGSDSAPTAHFDLSSAGTASVLGTSSGDLEFQAAIFDRLSDLINRYLGALCAELFDADRLTATLVSRTHMMSADLMSSDTFTATRLY